MTGNNDGITPSEVCTGILGVADTAMIQPIFKELTLEVIELAKELSEETGLELVEVFTAMGTSSALSMMIRSREKSN